MRVAQLVETLNVGGAQRLVVEIAHARAEAGDDSHIIVLAGTGPFSEIVSSRVTVHYLGLGHVSRRSLLTSLRRLDRLIERLGIEVLQTHLPGANYLGLYLAWRGRCRVFPTIHNTREFDYGEADSSLRGYLRRLAYRRLLVHGQAMIAVSEPVKAAMIRELGLEGSWCDRIVAVPNGTVVPPRLSAEEQATVKREFGVNPSATLVVGVGRLSAQKNFGDLIAALEALAGEDLDWHCLIAGEGELENELGRAIAAAGLEQRMELAGRVADVPRLFGAADIFCLPSLWEGLPLALLEALAAGLPVVAYDIDGVADVVTDGAEALLAPAASRDELALNLRRLLADPGRRQAMGQAGRDLVHREFSLEKVSRQLGTLYAEAGRR